MMLEKLRKFHKEGKQKGWKVMCEIPLPPAYFNGEQQGYVWKITNHTFPALVVVEAEKTDWSRITDKHINLFFDWLCKVIERDGHNRFPSSSILRRTWRYPCYIISDFEGFIEKISAKFQDHHQTDRTKNLHSAETVQDGDRIQSR